MTYPLPNFMRNQFAGDQLSATEHEGPRESMKELVAALWRALFLEITTQQELHEWEAKLPHYECPCAQTYRAFKRSNPPSFPLGFEWKYLLKSHINEKLNQPNLSFADAKAFWETKRNTQE